MPQTAEASQVSGENLPVPVSSEPSLRSVPASQTGGTSMAAHRTHRWHVRSLQQQFDLQHIRITWYCNVRGCLQLASYTHTFRKPPAKLGNVTTSRGGLMIDWRKDYA